MLVSGTSSIKPIRGTWFKKEWGFFAIENAAKVTDSLRDQFAWEGGGVGRLSSSPRIFYKQILATGHCGCGQIEVCKRGWETQQQDIAAVHNMCNMMHRPANKPPEKQSKHISLHEIWGRKWYICLMLEIIKSFFYIYIVYLHMITYEMLMLQTNQLWKYTNL